MARERRSSEMTLGGYGLRWLLTTLLVLASYNPSGYSAFDWFRSAWSDGTLGPAHYLVAVVILIGWVVLLRATFNSLGTLGLVLGTALLGKKVGDEVQVNVPKGVLRYSITKIS